MIPSFYINKLLAECNKFRLYSKGRKGLDSIWKFSKKKVNSFNNHTKNCVITCEGYKLLIVHILAICVVILSHFLYYYYFNWCGWPNKIQPVPFIFFDAMFIWYLNKEKPLHIKIIYHILGNYFNNFLYIRKLLNGEFLRNHFRVHKFFSVNDNKFLERCCAQWIDFYKNCKY